VETKLLAGTLTGLPLSEDKIMEESTATNEFVLMGSMLYSLIRFDLVSQDAKMIGEVERDITNCL